MKKIFLAVEIQPQFLQLLFVTALTFLIGACSKIKTDIVSPDNSLAVSQLKPPPPPPPGPSNPAIVFNTDTVFQFRGQGRSVQAIFVMDADGSHRKMIYNDFLTSGSSWSIGTASDPAWSANGQQICFAGRVASSSVPPLRPLSANGSIFTLNVSLVNGVPTASGLTKILDGAASGINYNTPRWSPTVNEIVVRASQTGNPEKLQIIPASGGASTTIYTAPTTDHIISSPCFSPDGSKLAFHLRNLPTGERWIKVIERTTGLPLNSIVLDPAYSWQNLNWSNTNGSTNLTFRNIIPNTGGQGALYTLDFNVSSTPVPVAANAAYPTWSPDDTKIAFSESTNSQGIIKVLTLSTNTVTTISTLGGYALNWKR
jgi:Tol biopolymer transport system component